MAGTRFGYPNINISQYSNEQNLKNAKTFMCNMSESVSQYIELLENEIETLRQEINSLKGE